MFKKYLQKAVFDFNVKHLVFLDKTGTTAGNVDLTVLWQIWIGAHHESGGFLLLISEHVSKTGKHRLGRECQRLRTLFHRVHHLPPKIVVALLFQRTITAVH